MYNLHAHALTTCTTYMHVHTTCATYMHVHLQPVQFTCMYTQPVQPTCLYINLYHLHACTHTTYLHACTHTTYTYTFTTCTTYTHVHIQPTRQRKQTNKLQLLGNPPTFKVMSTGPLDFPIIQVNCRMGMKFRHDSCSITSIVGMIFLTFLGQSGPSSHSNYYNTPIICQILLS